MEEPQEISEDMFFGLHAGAKTYLVVFYLAPPHAQEASRMRIPLGKQPGEAIPKDARSNLILARGQGLPKFPVVSQDRSCDLPQAITLFLT